MGRRVANWETCSHKFHPWFGPVLKCSGCGATTNMTSDPRESKPIFPPVSYEEAADRARPLDYYADPRADE